MSEAGEWGDPPAAPRASPSETTLTAVAAAHSAAAAGPGDFSEDYLHALDVLEDAEGDVTVAEKVCDEVLADQGAPESAKVAAYIELEKRKRTRDRASRRADQARTITASDTHSTGSADSAAAAEDDPAPYFGSVDEFVRDYLYPTYRRRIEGTRGGTGNSFRWDAEWWRHPEAVLRLDALWRAWEHLRLDPATGISVWLRDHADHHMPILLSDIGPFRAATDRVNDGDPLPYTPPPAGLFPDVRADDRPAGPNRRD